MPCLNKNLWPCLAGATLTLASAAALAAPTVYFAAQDPKPNLNDPRPPMLSAGVAAEQASFLASITTLGGQNFEAGPLNFSYTGGTAAISGNPTLPVRTNGAANPGLGRFSTTPGIVDGFGRPTFGYFIEAFSDFTISFSSAISAFAFFGTDFFDFAGDVSFNLLSSGNSIANGGIDTQNTNNGNLVFFGVTNTQAFDAIRFNITQQQGTNDVDVLGFDDLIVGNVVAVPPGTVPEPATLALVGLSLAGLAASRRAKPSA